VKLWPCYGAGGYLRVVEIALVHSRRWAVTLVVTAAAALAAGFASPALAQAGGAGRASTRTVEAKPLLSAGWHGQPIRRPYEAHSPEPTTARPPGSAAMRLGAGYGRAGGSAPVRRLQRMLRGLGYVCGPADGWFGPRTEASVQWFQIKHGLSATGVADTETLRILRFRNGLAAGTDRRTAARSAVIASPPAWPRADASPTQYDERHNGGRIVGSGMPALILSLTLAGLALLARAAQRRRVARGPKAALAPAGRRLAAPSRGVTAIGYARGRDAAEFKRHKAVIERACSHRGWTLASLVRDSHSANAGGRKRSGLAYALEQLANGDASRLVTGRLDHLARSPRRLGALLEWCAGHGVELVAVDVGLDTSTHDGRLVASRLLAAARTGGAHDARRTAARRRRADTRNGSRQRREEPIAASWRRKRPWR
jgi:DNA invertase Pin-like site-specific DNA recombinase/peptidoglycan hydrolase-like protein with peptidoglycan-binding domain